MHFTTPAHLYMTRTINHVAMEPQIARCVSHVHALVTRPAFRHTVTTTYYREHKKHYITYSVMTMKKLCCLKTIIMKPKIKILGHSYKRLENSTLHKIKLSLPLEFSHLSFIL